MTHKYVTTYRIRISINCLKFAPQLVSKIQIFKKFLPTKNSIQMQKYYFHIIKYNFTCDLQFEVKTRPKQGQNNLNHKRRNIAIFSRNP